MKKHTDFSRTLYKIVACATLLLTVGVFLERSGKYYVGAEAGGERKHVCTSLEEAKKLAIRTPYTAGASLILTADLSIRRIHRWRQKFCAKPKR